MTEKKKRMKERCIDCVALDYGFSENDCFPHCAIKHSRDLARGISRKQPEITREDAYKERECEYFRFEKKKDPLHVFHLTPEEVREGAEVTMQFQKELVEGIVEGKGKVKK